MPEGNPLVAQAQSQTTGVTGIGIAESAVDLANGVKDGSWVEGGLGAFGVGLEVLSLVTDPIGTLAQYGVSWLIEHVQPLKDCLDWLAGNPPVIQGFSDTWANVAKEVNAIAGDMSNEVKNGTAGWSGAGGDAYRGEVAAQTDAVAGAASLCDGISTGVMVMGQVVAAVRQAVRDLIAELVGKLISWALEEACTLGFATPVVAAQATVAITNTISKVTTLIKKLIKTISNVGPKVKKIVEKLGRSSRSSPSWQRSWVRALSTRPRQPPPSGSPDTRSGSTPDGTSGTSKSDGHVKSSVEDTKTASREKECVPGSGDPVDLATGQMFMTQLDVELPGMLPLIFQRTHFSSYRAGRLFGPTWASTLDQRLEIEDEGVYFADAGGVRLVYPIPPADGSPVLAVDGPRWQLRRTGDGYTIHQPETGYALRFGTGEGRVRRLDAVVNRSGHRIDFDYDHAFLPIGVRHSGGYRIGVDTENRVVTRLWMHNPDGDEITLVQGPHHGVSPQ
jgi:uncharacterized protein YukE